MRISKAAARAGVFAFSDEKTRSGELAHRSPDVMLSLDRLKATIAAGKQCGWVRAERGAGAGCGVVEWAVQLGREAGGHALGVCCETFKRYSAGGNRLKQVWFFYNGAVCADGNKPVYFSPPCFDDGDIVTFELERRPGVESVLRAVVAGKTPREIRGLPEDGVLYPIVCLVNDVQSVTMIPVPAAVVPLLLPEAAVPAAPPEPAAAPPPPARRARAGVFVFSSDAAHRSPDVTLSDDCTMASLDAFAPCGWARCERGAGAGCGVMRWAVKLGPDDGGNVFVMGVASEGFSEYSVSPCHDLKQLWMFQNQGVCSNGNRSEFFPSCFEKCDIVTFELERRPGVESVLRAVVAGKTPQEIRGLPEDGVLYPIVCLVNDVQGVTMVPLPKK